MSDAYIRKSGRTLVRLKNSTNGNARYRVTFDDGSSHLTKPDSMVTNNIESGTLDGTVEIRLDGRKRITEIRPMGESK